MSYMDGLNPEQRKAVECTQGPLLILAGAGSGKTRVLTCRVAHLIEQGVPAWKILAITFTNKAAREMAERVDTLTGTDGREAWVSTFHSCCAKILRRDIEKIGYSSRFVIYDEDDKQALIKTLLKELNMDEKQYPAKEMKAIISDAKNKMLGPEEWEENQERNPRNGDIARLYARYEAGMKANNALDFDDLLLKTLQLFTDCPPVLQYYQNRFDYILVDEYQDTNTAQYYFVQKLAETKRNLCVVGDDDQSIYGWRGADIGNILNFEKDFPDATVIKLEQNYRSTSTILDAANQVIAHNQSRKKKKLWTAGESGEKIRLYRALDERDEAAFIGNEISRLIAGGTRPGEIAVLYRTNAQSRVIEEGLVHLGLPHRVYGGLRFYDRKEIKDMIAYMRVLTNPDDDVSVRRIINEPKRGIGESTVEALAQYASENETSLMGAVLECKKSGLGARTVAKIEAFGQLMVDLTGELYEGTLSDFAGKLIERTGYIQALRDAKDADRDEVESRIENIREFQGAIREYEDKNPEGGMDGFLENIALITDIDNLNETTGAVTLMTMHSAKGLEFDAVFVAGMEDGIFPSFRADNEGTLEEERRLAYVAITRAKKRLYFLHARQRYLYNRMQYNPRCKFIDEIDLELINDGSARQNMRLGRPQQYRKEPEPSAPLRTQTRVGAVNIPGVTLGMPETNYEVGDAVEHIMFGPGKVVEVTADESGKKRMTIRFDTGSSRIFLTTVPQVHKI